jgi:hypothetical protein
MLLCDTAVKRPRPVAAIVLSLLGCVFGFDKIETSFDLKESQ